MKFSKLGQLKAAQIDEAKVSYKKNVVVGDDFFALHAYSNLLENEDNLIITKNEITRMDASPWGPNWIRGEENCRRLSDSTPDEWLTAHDHSAQFYKEMKFHKFGGRAKPETLLEGEEDYLEPSMAIDWEKAFEFLRQDQFWKRLSADHCEGVIVKIENGVTTDLLRPVNYRLSLGHNEIIECENLFWACSPHVFYELYENKKEIAEEAAELLSTSSDRSILRVRIETDKIFKNERGTFFIPLSYTHEWGHFIGEMTPSKEGQYLDFLTFINRSEADEEEVSRKIRTLYRQLEKIFSNFKKHIVSENVQLADSILCLNSDTIGKLEKSDCAKNIFFIGVESILLKLENVKNSFEYSSKIIDDSNATNDCRSHQNNL